MNQSISSIALVVKDYDEAIDFYVNKMGFELINDISLDAGKRWVLIKPKGKNTTALLLAKANSPKQEKAIGNQTGGRVFLFLNTDNFQRDYQQMLSNGIEFLEKPRDEVYGTVVVFKDLYGNKWDLIESKKTKFQLPIVSKTNLVFRFSAFLFQKPKPCLYNLYSVKLLGNASGFAAK